MTTEAESGRREELRHRFSELSKHGRKLDKAIDTALAGGVKESRFVPSGRRILTVVGRLGEEFIDPDKPYCSCSNFLFRVMTGKEETCYHLLSHTIASRSGRVEVTEFSDEEYGQFLKAVIGDVFDVMNRS
jgi:predicted nucleic acid-binding Zn finger protein